ncbi:FAD binding domain-containing protein [Tropicimonas sediminicola]|uniref:Carbon-monoxide dehydrogenase medium subunit/xanthine dehydrogenase FAD-binding subunit n=1 Tax=Tropicimonas sediminicola TaxID=1031541 RepID=A0A239M411_9RHOB|nr:FAD binding domain-containing protein [Tropicimonas sediminicola]SNT37406.1 carbon-monoxide dehydrogenase medium subunit/xanthine dehydrogenase FAD-binding subunit [Tropicimonas sediminicola]
MLTCQRYETPRTLAEALALWESAPDGARLIAGATDVLPWARDGRAGDVDLPMMIDLSRVSELSGYERHGGRVRLGANVVFQDFLEDPSLAAWLPVMPYCSVWFADDQIRQQATLAGNLVNASPAADGTPPVIALDGEIELCRISNGAVMCHTMPVAEFVTGPGRTRLAPNELVSAVTLDVAEGYGASFQKVGQRRSLVISVACVAALVKTDPTGTRFEDVRIALGGVGPVPQRLGDVEERLKGEVIDAGLIADVAAVTADRVASRSRVEYRRRVVPGFVRAALEEAVDRARSDRPAAANKEAVNA